MTPFPPQSGPQLDRTLTLCADAVPLVVWQVLDDKPGHRNQVLGLTEALQKITPVDLHRIDVSAELRGLRALLPWKLRRFASLPAPHLLLASGHGTHLPLLCLQRRFGGRSVVLMKPSLPLSLFDFCLIPDSHSFRRLPCNVELTQGAINRVRRQQHPNSKRGLILVGGPSDHFGWSNELVLSQTAEIVQRAAGTRWTIATSRRTPESFLRDYRSRGLHAELVPAANTTPDWLPAQLAECGSVWVTADSVSMLYEALTAGAAVGLMQLPDDSGTRVARTVANLIARRHVVPFSRWHRGTPLVAEGPPLQEADRCARLLLERFFSEPAAVARAA